MPFCRATLTGHWKPAEYPKEFHHLGDHIRAKRLDLGLQIKQLAKQLKTDEGSVASWEAGSRYPSLRKLPGVLHFIGHDPRPEATALGRKVRDRRRALGLSQKELAQRLGIDPSTVLNLEQGRKVTEVRLVLKILGGLGLGEPDLL